MEGESSIEDARRAEVRKHSTKSKAKIVQVERTTSIVTANRIFQSQPQWLPLALIELHVAILAAMADCASSSV
jgi:hypothetical protein